MQKKLNIKIMKKILLVLFFVQQFSSYAQDEKFFRLGIFGSPSVAWLKSETKEYDSKGVKLGFGYGLITEFSISKNYSFSCGLESAYSGGKLQWYGDTVKTEISKIQYLEFPVALKMKTNEINYITYFAKFGGGLNMRLRASADYEYKDKNGNPFSAPSDVDMKNEIYFFRISFLIGLGIEYSLWGNTAILFGLNFNNGLTNIFKQDGKKVKNNFITANVGILF